MTANLATCSILIFHELLCEAADKVSAMYKTTDEAYVLLNLLYCNEVTESNTRSV